MNIQVRTSTRHQSASFIDWCSHDGKYWNRDLADWCSHDGKHCNRDLADWCNHDGKHCNTDLADWCSHWLFLKRKCPILWWWYMTIWQAYDCKSINTMKSNAYFLITFYPVRLVPQSGSMFGAIYGAVEVLRQTDYRWLSVCDSSWDDNDAKVICKYELLTSVTTCPHSCPTKNTRIMSRTIIPSLLLHPRTPAFSGEL